MFWYGHSFNRHAFTMCHIQIFSKLQLLEVYRTLIDVTHTSIIKKIKGWRMW